MEEVCEAACAYLWRNVGGQVRHVFVGALFWVCPCACPCFVTACGVCECMCARGSRPFSLGPQSVNRSSRDCPKVLEPRSARAAQRGTGWHRESKGGSVSLLTPAGTSRCFLIVSSELPTLNSLSLLLAQV